jgi:hypothetical protein
LVSSVEFARRFNPAVFLDCGTLSYWFQLGQIGRRSAKPGKWFEATLRRSRRYHDSAHWASILHGAIGRHLFPWNILLISMPMRTTTVLIVDDFDRCSTASEAMKVSHVG